MNTDLFDLLRQVERPGRYIGGEINEVIKDTDDDLLRMAFAFPDLYEIGMSYMGLQILYNAVNSCPELYMERVFEPAKDMRDLMKKEDIPLFTLETKTSVRDMDVLGFTLQYEMSYTTIIDMLELSSLHVLADERTEDEPLVIAGGPCSFNPEPLAPFIDCFLIGDGEELLPDFLTEYNESKKRGVSKEDFLKHISSLDGVYVPSLYTPEYDNGRLTGFSGDAAFPVKKSIVSDLDDAGHPVKMIVPNIEAVHDRAVVESFRGCTRGCRFCQAGMIYRPVRERSADNILDIAKNEIKATGHDELSLLSLSTSDHSSFEDMATKLMKYCAGENVALSLPSLRFDSFSFSVLNEIQKYKKSGLTFAVEAGTQRLRDAINKGITEEEVMDACSKAMDLGWRHVKLYFMIGLPDETYEDLDGIPDIARKIMDLSREKGLKGRFNVTVSCSNFVPKPFTPYQWRAQDTEEELLDKKHYLLERLKIKGVRFTCHDAFVSKIEGILAKGDRKVSELLLIAHRNGCNLDGWSEFFDDEAWRKSLSEFSGDALSYAETERNYDDILPWDLIDCGVTKEYLEREDMLAKEHTVTRDCRKGCNNCGLQRFMKCPVYGG